MNCYGAYGGRRRLTYVSCRNSDPCYHASDDASMVRKQAAPAEPKKKNGAWLVGKTKEPPEL